MESKDYFVIQNKEGKFFKADNLSGGYPVFIDDFEFADKFGSREFVEENFLKGDYVTKLFKKEFEGARVRKIIMTLV